MTSAILVCFGLVLLRLYWLHIHTGAELAAAAERSRRHLQIKPACRGRILDARGELLAVSRPVIELGVDPRATDPGDVSKWPDLARLAGISLARVRECFSQKESARLNASGRETTPVRWRKLAESLDERAWREIMALGIRGVYGNRKYRRFYPAGPIAAHITGYLNKDNLPVMGAEKHMDYYLRGQNGWREIEVDGRRREMARFRRRKVEPADGLDVELTLDLVIQQIAVSEVRRLVEEYRPESVTILISEPSTGDVLGLANAPAFDPNHYNKYPVANQRNRAVTDIFEPGSTFKIVAASAALNENLVNENTVIDCGLGVAEHAGRRLSLPKDHRPLGPLTVADIICKSSNRGAARLGLLLGSRRLYEYCGTFGFGEKTGYALGGEAPGILHPVREWDGLTITRLPIGHAVAATPIQVHFAMAALANRGVLMAPRLVSRVLDAQGEVLLDYRPRGRRRAVSARTASRMARLLQRVASPEGTAPLAAIPSYQVAGKTGTTQKIVGGQYSHDEYVASFTGFFPASNPRLAVTVVVNSPQTDGPAYGGVVSAPAFKNIARKLITYLAIRPPDVPADERLAFKR